MAKNTSNIVVYLSKEQEAWFREKEKQGYKKSGLVRFLISEHISREAVGIKSQVAEPSSTQLQDAWRPPRSTAAPPEETRTKEEENAEEKKVDRYADTMGWYMDNPEAVSSLNDPLLKAFIERFIKEVRAQEDAETCVADIIARKLNGANGNPQWKPVDYSDTSFEDMARNLASDESLDQKTSKSYKDLDWVMRNLDYLNRETVFNLGFLKGAFAEYRAMVTER